MTDPLRHADIADIAASPTLAVVDLEYVGCARQERVVATLSEVDEVYS